MKKLVFFICFIVISSNVFAQLRLDENFSYTPIGDSLGAGAPGNGWVSNSGGGINPIPIAPGLTYAGYPLSGIGNGITLANTGQDKYKNFAVDSVKSGSVYASFMVRVDSARTGDYFVALLQAGSATAYEGRVQVRSIDGSGLLSFGITKGNSASDTTVAGIWTPHSYVKGVTYLLVLKYTFVTGGTTNDQVSLFVLSSGVPSVEPAPALGPVTYASTDATVMGRIGIRQGTNTKAPNCAVDGIRISTSWFSTVLEVKFAVQGLLIAGGTHSVADSVTVNVRSFTSPYAILYTSYAIIDPATLTAYFPLSNSVATGTYYLDTRYRHSLEFQNGIETWSATGQPIAPYNAGIYNYTNDVSKAYGSNEVVVFGVSASYNGDINQDATIDAGDLSSVENDAGIGATGYLANDLTGDDYVDAGDLSIVENNAGIGIAAITP